MRRVPLVLLALGWSAGCAQLLGDVDLRDPVEEPAPAPTDVNQQAQSLEPTGSLPTGLPRLCDTGQTRCLGGLLEECDADFGNWKVVDSCATPDLCELGRTTLGTSCAPPRCAAADRVCDGQTLRACNTGQTGWTDAQVCAETERCDPRLGCTALPCTFGEERCNGGRIEVCQPPAGAFVPTSDAPCATAQLCSDSPDGGVGCSEPVCAAGQFRCEGTLLQRCSDGRDAWVDFQRCATPELCDATRGAQGCETPSCEAGTRSCVGDTLMQCRATREGSDPVANCVSAGGCDPMALECRDPCIVGGARCSGAALQTCNDPLIGWQSLTCVSADLCNAAARRCDPPVCAAADRGCRGAQPQRCAAGRNALVDFGAPCASAALCNPGTGTCTPPACNAGATDCDGRDVLLVCNADRTGFDAIECGRDERCRGTPAECR